MGCGARFGQRPVSYRLVFLLVIGCAMFPRGGLYAADKARDKPEDPLFIWDLLWTGSYARSFKIVEDELSAELVFPGGTLINRGELRLNLPRQHLNFRFQGIDKRILAGDGTGKFSPGFGIYFDGKAGNFLGNSRLLRGVLDEYGLPARIRNMWAKSAPYAEYRRPMMSDLKTDPSGHEPESYLYLGLPHWGLLSGFAFAQTDDVFNPSFGTGFEFKRDRFTDIKIDAFYTRRTLAEHNPQSWFSLSPPLPEREFHLFALGTSFDTKVFSLAGDLACSQTFAWGRDFYGNASIRIGNRPWKFSLATDGAGSRYTGRDGNAPGPGFRLASRLERQWVRSGLFRINAVLRSPLWGSAFDRSSLSIYYRPSAPQPKHIPFFRFTRASLSLNRNASLPAKTDDSLEVMAGFNMGSFRNVLSGNIHCLSALDPHKAAAFPVPPCFGNFNTAKISADTSWGARALQLRFGMGYTIRAGKDNIWDLSLNSSVKLKNFGRLGLKISAPDFPDKWSYALSWRLERVFR